MVATKKVGYHCKATVIDRDKKRKKKTRIEFCLSICWGSYCNWLEKETYADYEKITNICSRLIIKDSASFPTTQ